MCFIPMYLWRQHVPMGMAQPGETHESVISTKIQLTWFSCRDFPEQLVGQVFRMKLSGLHLGAQPFTFLDMLWLHLFNSCWTFAILEILTLKIRRKRRKRYFENSPVLKNHPVGRYKAIHWVPEQRKSLSYTCSSTLYPCDQVGVVWVVVLNKCSFEVCKLVFKLHPSTECQAHQLKRQVQTECSEFAKVGDAQKWNIQWDLIKDCHELPNLKSKPTWRQLDRMMADLTTIARTT